MLIVVRKAAEFTLDTSNKRKSAKLAVWCPLCRPAVCGKGLTKKSCDDELDVLASGFKAKIKHGGLGSVDPFSFVKGADPISAGPWAVCGWKPGEQVRREKGSFGRRILGARCFSFSLASSKQKPRSSANFTQHRAVSEKSFSLLNNGCFDLKNTSSNAKRRS
jgi:hypothetical protein